jgi:hypothetical protein
VVALYAWTLHGPNNVQACFRIRAVAHNVSQERVMAAALLARMLQDGLQGFEIRVDIG